MKNRETEILEVKTTTELKNSTELQTQTIHLYLSSVFHIHALMHNLCFSLSGPLCRVGAEMQTEGMGMWTPMGGVMNWEVGTCALLRVKEIAAVQRLSPV